MGRLNKIISDTVCFYSQETLIIFLQRLISPNFSLKQNRPPPFQSTPVHASGPLHIEHPGFIICVQCNAIYLVAIVIVERPLNLAPNNNNSLRGTTMSVDRNHSSSLFSRPIPTSQTPIPKYLPGRWVHTPPPSFQLSRSQTPKPVPYATAPPEYS